MRAHARARWRAKLIFAALLAAAPARAAGAEEPTRDAEEPAPDEASPSWERFLDNDYYKVSLDVRARIEVADFDGFSQSEAYTMRTLAGIGSKPWYGLSAYAELENSFSFDDSQYFDAVETPTGQTVIADPSETDLDQGWLRYQNDELGKLQVTGGRQRVVLDDHRFIGNVGWRQNEQTYDAAWAANSLGVDALQLSYGYLWQVHRIFGNDGPPALRDFDSDSHLVRLAYSRFPLANVVAFAYLLDFDDDSPVNSANTYGGRVTGTHAFGAGPWSVGYAGSYAYQTDAGRNPVSYHAHYAAADGSLGYTRIGRLGLGYELLGSDDGRARVVTPLATAHKFNGWADVFLDNGGTNGLQDLYLYAAPALPWKLAGQVVFHRFWSHENGTQLGDEWDVVLSRPITRYFVLLAKGAYFDGRRAGPADGWRTWLELTFHY